MQSKTYLADLSERVIEAGWLATLVLAPLFFNPYSSRVFEPDKVALVRSLALVMIAAWVLRWIERSATHGFRFRPASLRLPPLGIPVAALVLAWLLATALSLQPMVSLMGSYARSQGVYTTLCGAALFFFLAGFLRERAQLERVVDAIILTSLPLSLYALVQYAGNDPLAWQQGFGARVFSTQGNPLFLSALLAMMFFPTISRAFACLDTAEGHKRGWWNRLPALGYFLLAAFQLLALLFADSRGPVFAWLLALGLFVLARLLQLRARALSLDQGARVAPLSPADLGRAVLLAVFAILVAAIASLLVLGGADAGGGRLGSPVLLLPVAALLPILVVASRSPAAARWAWAAVPAALLLIGLAFAGLQLGTRLGVIGGEVSAPLQRAIAVLDAGDRSGKARAYLWQGAARLGAPHDPLQGPDGREDALNALRPWIGHGPETLFVAFNRFYAPQLAALDTRNAMPDRAHNEVFDSLIATGLIGASALQILFIAAFQLGLSLLGWLPSRRAGMTSLAMMLLGGVVGIAASVALKGASYLGPGWTAGVVAGLLSYAMLFATFRSGVSRAAYSWACSALLLAVAALAVPVTATASAWILSAEVIAACVLACILVYRLGEWLFQDRAGEVESEPGLRLLAAALFACVLAHYLEIGTTGIATISTRTYFWVFAGLLAVLAWRFVPGKHLLRDAASEHALAPLTLPAGARLPDGTGVVVATAMLTCIAMASGLFAFVNNQKSLTGGPGFEQFASRLGLASETLTRLPSQDHRHSFSVLLILIATWAAGAWLCIAALRRNKLPASRTPMDAAFLFFVCSAAVLLAYGVLHATALVEMGRLAQAAWTPAVAGVIRDLAPLMSLAERATWLPLYFTGFVLLLLLVLAIALGPRLHRPYRIAGPLRGRVALVLLLPLLAFGIVRSNFDGIRANTLFRQAAGLPAEDAWDAVLLHQARAISLQPAEDRYYAWMGDAYLQKAVAAKSSNAPRAFSAAAALAPDARGLRELDRETALKSAEVALQRALSLAPLDPDHSANLARLHGYWARHARGDQQTRHLDAADRFYRQATALSPNRAQFWNEWARLQLDQSRLHAQLGDQRQEQADLAVAEARLARSLQLDRRYDLTYVAAAELDMARGRRRQAADNYRKALAITPALAQGWRGLVAIHRIDPAAARLEATALRHLRRRSDIVPALRLLVAEIYLPSDRLAEAIRAQRRVVALTKSQPARSFEQLALALLLADANSPTEALAAAQESLNGLPAARRADAENLVALLRRVLGAGATR